MAESPENTRDFGSLRWDHLEGLASQLEEAWKKGGPVDLAPLLPELDDPLRTPTLVELIKVDLECRWRKGQPVVLDYYTDKFRELGPTRGLPAALVFEEYRVRQLFGDKPPLALYQTRFPNQFEEMKRLLGEQPLPTNPLAAGPTINKEVGDNRSQKPEGATARNLKETVLKQTGGYRMTERLGAGAFGEVWKAEAPGGIFKAIKVIFRPIDHDEAKRELESLELTKAMRHHFLLQTHSFWTFEDRLYILMDLADCTLRDRLKLAKKEGKTGLPLHELVRYFREASEALDYLHAKGVQHRDIKPENLLLSDNNIRVADFGLARVQKTQRLVSGSGAGTPLYMPPEAWNDKAHSNSDQYSLAATYAECRLGRRIYDAEGMATLMQAHLSGKPNLNPLPAEEQKVLLKALAKNPVDRYPTCVAFSEDLERAVAPFLPPGMLRNSGNFGLAGDSASGKNRTKERLILIGGLVVALVVALLSIFVFRPPAIHKDSEKIVQMYPSQSPAGSFRPVEGAETVMLQGKPYPKQIECVLAAKPEMTVKFMLVPWDEKAKQTFYMMEDKVWNDLYAQFALERPDAVNGSRWRLGARVGYERTAPLWPVVAHQATLPWQINAMATVISSESRRLAQFHQESWPQPNDLGVRDGRLPVLRVDIQEAQRCAEWLGGILPSAEQWDKAAGRFETPRGEGPYQIPFGPDEVAVNRSEKGPMPVGTASKDVSPYSKCRDMAGNGLEWTRIYWYDQESWEFLGDVSKVPPLAKVPMRGRDFNHPEPLNYEDLKERPLDLEFWQANRQPGLDAVIGFRVAILP